MIAALSDLALAVALIAAAHGAVCHFTNRR